MALRYIEKLGIAGLLIGVTYSVYSIFSYTNHAEKMKRFTEMHPAYTEYSLVKQHKRELADFLQQNAFFLGRYSNTDNIAMAEKNQRSLSETIKYYDKQEQILEEKIPREIHEALTLQKQLDKDAQAMILSPLIVMGSLGLLFLGGERKNKYSL